MNQRPSYEYYSVFKGPFIEHMIYYLAKTGGDARLFPELLPHKWFCDIYDVKFRLLNILQERRRAVQTAAMAREATLEYHPSDMDHDGEA
jgi:hypothetical protein